MGAYLCKNFGIVVVRNLCATVSEMKRPHCKGHVTACTMARARFAGSPDCAIENVSIRRCEHLHAANTHVEDAGADENCHGCARSGHILMNCAKSHLRRNRVASSAQRPLDGGGRMSVRIQRMWETHTWRGNPARCEVHDRQPLQPRRFLQQMERGLNLFRVGVELLLVHDARLPDL